MMSLPLNNWLATALSGRLDGDENVIAAGRMQALPSVRYQRQRSARNRQSSYAFCCTYRTIENWKTLLQRLVGSVERCIGDNMKFNWKQFAIALGLFLLGYLTFNNPLFT